MTNLCVLRSGGEYTPQHVQWLARQVPGLRCLSDVRVPGVKTIPLYHDWPGWWAKMELFRPDITGDVMFYDLDTVVRRPITAERTTVLRDFYRPRGIGSGLMYLREPDRAAVWDKWISSPQQHMRANVRHGDQGFLESTDLLHAARWQDTHGVVSYKAHSAEQHATADVVCFHGKPRPWDAHEPWIPPVPSDFRALDFTGLRVLVLGGGPSLAEDVARAPAHDVVISTNAHGVELCPPDYVVAVDERHGTALQGMLEYVRERTNAPLVGPQRHADYHLHGWPRYPRRLYSGNTAVWMAAQCGASVIYVAGVDGYSASPNYLRQVTDIMQGITVPVYSLSGDIFTPYDMMTQ